MGYHCAQWCRSGQIHYPRGTEPRRRRNGYHWRVHQKELDAPRQSQSRGAGFRAVSTSEVTISKNTKEMPPLLSNGTKGAFVNLNKIIMKTRQIYEENTRQPRGLLLFVPTIIRLFPRKGCISQSVIGIYVDALYRFGGYPRVHC